VAERVDGLAVKDPRFCLTLPVWQQWTKLVVVCLRSPAAVVASLRRRQRVPASLALRFWNHHAEGLVRAAPTTGVYVDFDAFGGGDREQEVGRLVRGLGLTISMDEAMQRFAERYSRQLRHADAAELSLPARTQRLWDELQARRSSPEV
jgi:hypothetical protein